MTIELIIFDLDGTLVDSLEDIATSVNAVLREAGLPTHSTDAYRAMVGDGLAKLVERAVGADADRTQDLAQLLAAARERYAAHCTDATRLYPGIRELVDALVERGIPLAVLSNKPHPMTLEVVGAAFSPATFVAIAGDRPGIPIKPDPGAALDIAAGVGVDPAATLFVGDTPVDVATATAAGMTSVGVTWGFRTAQELREAGAHHLIEQPAQLLDLLT